MIRSNRRALVAMLAATLALGAPAIASAKQPTGCTSGTGLVFMPNPVVSSGSYAGLEDLKDADSAALNAERVQVTLTGLDGSGYLRGTYSTVVGATGDSAYSADCTFNYTRHDDRFEQVMAYYWVTESQAYTRGLGFTAGSGLWREINADQQRVRINQYGVDNSFATTHPKDEMRFGKGGVDDAEDGEVILHELGHQIHFSQSSTFFSTTEAGGISEGFGDYWAATVSEWATGGEPDPECIAEWDSISYTPGPVHCLRRLDRDLMYPDDITGRVHRDGQIWSHALWNLRGAIGATHADTAILQAQFDWTGTDMPELAQRIVDRVAALYPGEEAAAEAAFAERGIL
ncbi:MAG: M36 family metallopeptidase [Candidatus Limnocylindrales bacterium]